MECVLKGLVCFLLFCSVLRFKGLLGVVLVGLRVGALPLVACFVFCFSAAVLVLWGVRSCVALFCAGCCCFPVVFSCQIGRAHV